MRLFQRFSGGIFAALLALLCFLAAVRSNAQSAGCPSISSSSCPSVNWQTPPLISIPVITLYCTDGTPYIRSIGIDVCYRCCNGKAEIHIKQIVGCDAPPTGKTIDHSSAVNRGILNKAIMEQLIPSLGGLGCGTIPPCPAEDGDQLEIDVSWQECYRYSRIANAWYSCSNIGKCTYCYKVCYTYNQTLNINEYHFTPCGFSSQGTSNCPQSPGISSPFDPTMEDICFSWCY